jgi:HAD superfamily hydrolase (TIGR01549 family)
MGTLLRGDDTLPYWEGIGHFLEREGTCSATSFAQQYSEWRKNRTPSLREVPLRDRVAMFAHATQAQLATIETSFLQEYCRNSSVIDGVEQMLMRWHGHAALGVISNFFLASAPRELLRAHHLLQYFDFVLDSAQVGTRKPDRAIFERALRATRMVQPAEAVMIGDDWQADVQGALAVGMRAVHFASSDTHNGQVPILQTWDNFRPAA